MCLLLTCITAINIHRSHTYVYSIYTRLNKYNFSLFRWFWWREKRKNRAAWISHRILTMLPWCFGLTILHFEPYHWLCCTTETWLHCNNTWHKSQRNQGAHFGSTFCIRQVDEQLVQEQLGALPWSVVCAVIIDGLPWEIGIPLGEAVENILAVACDLVFGIGSLKFTH